jgi:hypothetical protein
VRRLVEINPGNADPARPGDITSGATRTLADLIATELPRVHAASEEMWRRVSSDPKHLALDPATQRKRGTKRPTLTLPAARSQRRRLVRSIVYQATAADITLADAPERMHRLCDRRLRLVERMVYDVGRVEGRSWSRAQIERHPGGPWPDGYERLFEYPRIPSSLFLRACRVDANRRCRAPMNEWGYPSGDVNLIAAVRANAASAGSWQRRNEYEIDYVPRPGVAAVSAIQQLFQPSTDFLARNLMYCDHTIHALHLEALVFAMTKRGRGTQWLDDEITAKGDRWLRIHFQFENPERFLAGSSETLFFEHVSVRQGDLQVGDHLIVYNHPAYAKATVSGVWKLENAVVVQTFPDLLLQGHGTVQHTLGGMWEVMIDYFHKELDRRRADVERLARVQGFGQNTLTVDDTRYLAPGISIDIVRDDSGEAVLAGGREIVSMSGRTIRYAGGSVSAPTPHRLRRARSTAFDDAKQAITSHSFRIVRRVAPAASQYDAVNQRADWFLVWVAGPEEEAIRRDSARAAFVKERQLIEYTREREGGNTKTIGWFPLWRPAKKGGAPPRKNGRIVSTEPVRVEPRNVAGWTWFFDPDPARRDRVPVVRPREL